MTTQNPYNRPSPAGSRADKIIPSDDELRKIVQLHSSSLQGSTPTKKNTGPLQWQQLVEWLEQDLRITAETASHFRERLSGADSKQHPLVRLAQLKLPDVKGNVLDLDALTQWLASHIKMPFLRIDPMKAHVGKIGDLMSIEYAQKHEILPTTVSPTEVTVATSQPFQTEWIKEIEHTSRKRVRLVLSSPADIARYSIEFFTLAKSVRNVEKRGGASTSVSFEQLVDLGKTGRQLDANDQGIVQLVDWLWQYAFDQHASDIHLEPRRETGSVRFRIDGVLHTVYQLPMPVMNAVLARVKLLGRMDVVEKRRPLDGRIKTRSQFGAEIEMRLSTLPTAFGEKMVMRIFDPDTAIKNMEELGFPSKEAQQWDELTHRPNGIILVTGPTGSGKTTTLYSTLKQLATEEVNLCTIEDPIEMVDPTFNQMQVQTSLDLGFAEGVRALMRQDPDIIMIGEIRDTETANMAVQAALTGHLVLSTLHTNDAPSAITRLMDLGVPAYLLSATLLGILAQRLVRTLCPSCKEPDEDFNIETLGQLTAPWSFNGEIRPYKAIGCLNCRNTGYKGRTGLYEMLVLDETFRKQLSRSPNLDTLRTTAIKQGLKPLRLAGLLKVGKGITTVSEVLAATPPIEIGSD